MTWSLVTTAGSAGSTGDAAVQLPELARDRARCCGVALMKTGKMVGGGRARGARCANAADV